MENQDQRKRVLFVCTANICRSPTAEYLARHRFGSDVFHVRSAGFMAADKRCPDELQRVLASRGVSVADHRSYKLDVDTLTAADLILTMESRHVLDATVLDRRSLRKIMPLKEAAREIRKGETIDAFLERINGARDPHKYLSVVDLDVADPYKKRLKAYEKAVEEIDGLVSTLLSRLQ
jgi:protein-tyrosine-phosphatase